MAYERENSCSLFMGLRGSKELSVEVWVFGLGCGSKES